MTWFFNKALLTTNERQKKKGNSFTVPLATSPLWLFYDSQEGHTHLKIHVFNDFGRLMCCFRLTECCFNIDRHASHNLLFKMDRHASHNVLFKMDRYACRNLLLKHACHNVLFKIGKQWIIKVLTGLIAPCLTYAWKGLLFLLLIFIDQSSSEQLAHSLGLLIWMLLRFDKHHSHLCDQT